MKYLIPTGFIPTTAVGRRLRRGIIPLWVGGTVVPHLGCISIARVESSRINLVTRTKMAYFLDAVRGTATGSPVD